MSSIVKGATHPKGLRGSLQAKRKRLESAKKQTIKNAVLLEAMEQDHQPATQLLSWSLPATSNMGEILQQYGRGRLERSQPSIAVVLAGVHLVQPWNDYRVEYKQLTKLRAVVDSERVVLGE